MYKHQGILFMDIETVPLVWDYEELSDRMKTEWTKKSKNIKIENEEHPTAERLFLEKSGVYSEFAKVVCIGFGSFQLQNDVWKMRLKSIAADDEKELLKSFAEVVNRFVTFNPQMSFCGHNIKEFDLPFLCRRMLINCLPIPDVMNLSGKKPWENPHQDTLELWKFGDYKNYTSLALLAEVLGIPSPKDDIDGSMVSQVYYEEHNLPRIARYCLQDVATAARVYMRLKGQPCDFETVYVDE